MEAWVSALGSLVAMGAFGIASAFLRRTHRQLSALTLGVGCSIVFAALCWLFNSVEFVGAIYATLLSLIVVSCLAAYAGEAIDS